MDREGGMAKKTLGFVALFSFLSLFYSYFSSYNNSNIEFSTLIFPLVMERKYMFLICNGIVAFLVNNLSLSSSSASAEIGQISLNAASEEEFQEEETEMDRKQECEAGEETNAVDESEEEEEMDRQQECQGGEETNAEDESEEEEEEEEEENKAVSDARVSTEELNHKFEEFIRKMKEEIRIEAHQHLIPAPALY